ncbi:MAG TPA: response regulator [Pirellulales bacterium]|nr:response regulator [Pirellulales bacterium]
MDINQKLFAAFQVEHVEHLEAIRSCLARWGHEDATAEVDEAFRHAHSLKGAARVTGFSSVETLAHQLEGLFSLLRAKELPADAEVITAVQSALDAIEDSAACLLQGSPAPDSNQVSESLAGFLQSTSKASDGLVAASPIKDSPARETFQRRSPPAANSEKLSMNAASDLAEQGTVSKPLPRTATQAIDTVRLSTEHLDRLLQSTGQLLTENLQQEALSQQLSALHQQLIALQREWESLKRTTAGPLRRMNNTPEMAGLAKYIDLVEHEFTGLARHVRSARLLQHRSSCSVRLLAEQLQDDVRRARMVPVESEFQGFRKMMRDLARDEGKQIDFSVVGFEALADRMVLQTLKDPLMHVLRNAITHGIELPAERTERGKSAAGQVTLTIQTIGSRLTIEVEDDGRGVDLAEVSHIAVQRGILSQSEATSQSPVELTRLLLLPGFTTSRMVTELSGRGMGLSAVYEAVTRLQGEVEVRPRGGGGTSILLTVPLSISTHRLLLVSCHGQTIAIPFYGIEALHRIKLSAVETVEGIPMVSLAGQLAPLAGLAQLLDNSLPSEAPAGDALSVVLMCSASRRVAVVVDALVAERNALIKNLGPPANTHSALLGGILLEDGSVSPVVNTADLVERFKPSKKTGVAATIKPADAKRSPTILVVDDSFTTRTLETSILETNGYQVRVAVDGVQALELLRSEKVDLVITDIEMPRMDGFALLEQMKADTRMASLPVILVTSRDQSVDKQRGLELGADAYIVKRKFDHQDLLSTIEQVL